MELVIETLTGTAFELRVSPFETIVSVKAKIQRLEGIPISQQHLIFQSTELQDDLCLHDYNIYDGATLKLVLAMRGGPINTRRIPMEDSTLREMAEYVEANRDEIWEKLPGNRQVTILVFREGDQLNFFRFVDRGDGSLTPLSESLSGTSMFMNEDYDEEEVKAAEAAYAAEKDDEHERLKERMQTLKAQMEKLSLEKPAPITKRPGSGRQSAQSRLQSRPVSNVKGAHHSSLSKVPCLPPVGQSIQSIQRHLSKEEQRVSSSEAEELNFNSSDGESPTDPRLILSKLTSNLISSPEPIACGGAKSPDPLSFGKSIISPSPFLESGGQFLEAGLPERTPEDSFIAAGDSVNRVSKVRRPVTSSIPRELAPIRDAVPKKKELTLDSIKDILRPPSTSATSSLYKRDNPIMDNTTDLSKPPPLPPPSKHDLTLQSIKDALARSSTKYESRERKKECGLDSLTSSEARVMSGLLRQASIEKLGTSRLETFLPNAGSKSRLGSYTGTGLRTNRRQTPEAALASSLLRMSAHRDTRLSPTYRLPPVKPKKKTTKRCLFCAKKTGLATSYICRCGNNFCATHRYAESHNCSYDYKSEGRKLLEQNNPVVAAPKLPKI